MTSNYPHVKEKMSKYSYDYLVALTKRLPS